VVVSKLKLPANVNNNGSSLSDIMNYNHSNNNRDTRSISSND